MGYEVIDVYFPVHVPVYYFGNVRTSLRTTKRGAFPGSSRDELERAGRDLLASSSYPNDD